MKPKAIRNPAMVRGTDGQLRLELIDAGREVVLDPLAELVWDLSDGSRSLEGMAQAASRAFGRVVQKEEVFSALDFLADAGLIGERVAPAVAEGKVSRRSLLVQIAPVVGAAAWIMSRASATNGGLFQESSVKELATKEPDRYGLKLVGQELSEQRRVAEQKASRPELVPQLGHADGVISVAFSPDGRTVASGGKDTIVKLWEVTTGRELGTLNGHSEWVSSVAFSPDGRWLASGSWDKTVKLWEVATGRELRTLSGHTSPVLGVAFRPDGRWLASGGKDKIIKLWDVATGGELRTLNGHTERVASVAFSPDGRWLASGSDDSTVKLWDVATGGELRTLNGHTGGVMSVTFSPDGRWLASGSASFKDTLIPEVTVMLEVDGEIKLWEVATGRELNTLHMDKTGFTEVAFSPDGRWLASVSLDDKHHHDGHHHEVELWEAGTGRLSCTLNGHTDTITSLAISPDGRWLVTGSLDKTLKLWEVATGRELRTMHSHIGPIWSLALSPDGRWIAYGDSKIQLCDLAKGLKPSILRGHTIGRTGRVWSLSSSLAFSPDGRWLASGDKVEGQVTLWKVVTGREVRTSNALSISDPAFSPDGRWLAWGRDDGKVTLLEVATGHEVHTLDIGNKGSIDALAFSQDGRRLVSGGWREVKMWDVASGRELLTLSGQANVTSLAFSRNDRLLASASHGAVTLWEVATGRELRTLSGHTGTVENMTFSRDDRWLASGSWDKTVKLWEVATGRELRTLSGHTSPVLGVAFRPDGRLLISGSQNGSVRIWEASTGEQLAAMFWMEDSNDRLVVTPDGLFDGSENGMLLVAWRIGNQVYPPDKFFADYHTPGLLARILAGERPKPKVDRRA